MPQIILNVTPELSSQINHWSKLGKETPEQLTLRLLQEYVYDCENAEIISDEVASGKMDWADMPLTADEETGLKKGRENIKSGDFMTLAELKIACGQ